MTTERKIYSSIYPVVLLLVSPILGGVFGAPIAVCGIMALVMVWAFKADLAALYKNLLLMWALAIVTAIFTLAASHWLLTVFLAIVASIALCIIVCQNVREGIALMAVNPCLHFILILAILEWYAANIGFDEKLPMT